MIYVFLADGFEECEAVAPVDMLRRAALDVKIVKVGGNAGDKKVKSSHNLEIIADIHESEAVTNGLEMIVFPGGGEGTDHLYESGHVRVFIVHCVQHRLPIGAICAAPSILARLGYLKNIKSTAYPTFRHYLSDGGAILEENKKVVTDGIFTTAAAAGASVEFGLELVRVIKGEEESKKIAGQILA